MYFKDGILYTLVFQLKKQLCTSVLHIGKGFVLSGPHQLLFSKTHKMVSQMGNENHFMNITYSLNVIFFILVMDQFVERNES